MRTLRLIMAASAAMIIVGVAIPAWAQDAPQSVAPPPTPGSGSMVLFNQIQGLREQMQAMQGQIEVLQHKLQQLQQASKDQYVDVNSRLDKLEHAQAAPAASSSAAPSSTPPASAKVAPAASSSTAPMSAADKAQAQTAYEAAFKELRAGNYVDSARQFRAFIDKYPDSKLVSNAYYWLGGSYYVTQNYKPALAAFRTLLEKYPDSPKAADAKLRVADCQIGLKDYTAARTTLEAVIKAHPSTSLEKRAKDRMDDLPAPTSAK